MQKKLECYTAAGVVAIEKDGLPALTVNDVDIIAEVTERVIIALRPKLTHDGRFAGLVTISIELLGDTEDDSEEENC